VVNWFRRRGSLRLQSACVNLDGDPLLRAREFRSVSAASVGFSRIMLGSMLLAGGAGLALVSPVGFVAGVAAIAAGTRLIGKTIARAA